MFSPDYPGRGPIRDLYTIGRAISHVLYGCQQYMDLIKRLPKSEGQEEALTHLERVMEELGHVPGAPDGWVTIVKVRDWETTLLVSKYLSRRSPNARFVAENYTDPERGEFYRVKVVTGDHPEGVLRGMHEAAYHYLAGLREKTKMPKKK